MPTIVCKNISKLDKANGTSFRFALSAAQRNELGLKGQDDVFVESFVEIRENDEKVLVIRCLP